MKIYEVLKNKEIYEIPCIYLWKNLCNGKVYIGQTQNFYCRMRQYARFESNRKRTIVKALAKYGFDNFDISILEKVDDVAKLDDREQFWMDYYNSYDKDIGYNICKESGTSRGYSHTEEDKQRMSEIAKERFRQHPEKMPKGEKNPMYGRTVSKETREKMSKSRQGNQNAKGKTWKLKPEFVENRRKRALGNKNCLGRKISEKHRARIIESNQIRGVSEETKKKISEANKGKSAKKVRCVETGIVYDSITRAGEAINRSSSGISACLKGKMKTCGGYHWEYYTEK